jgi:hypothetical protein
MSLKMLLAGCAAAAMLCACASNRVDFGGVMSPLDVPANATFCAEAAWRPVERIEPVYPDDLAMFLFAAQDASGVRSFLFNFDITETGSTANIRFVEPAAYTSHATMRKAILSSAEAIAQWRYETSGEALHATGCSVRLRFALELETQ